MKKTGFTLAEVLVTIALIGVVATLTLPALNIDTSNAQIGPKLTKAVGVLEEANELLLNEQSSNSISGVSDGKSDVYTKFLKDHIKCNVRINEEIKDSTGATVAPLNNATVVSTKDGIDICFPEKWDTSDATKPYERRIDMHKKKYDVSSILIDINGIDVAPNKDAKDRFWFAMYDDGSLRPQGATNWNEDNTSLDGGKYHWKKKCPSGEKITGDNLRFCAGSIFENDRKVLYK